MFIVAGGIKIPTIGLEKLKKLGAKTGYWVTSWGTTRYCVTIWVTDIIWVLGNKLDQRQNTR